MKSEKGITLISVIIYLFAMVMALTIVGLITSFFFENIYEIKDMGELTSEYNKFNIFFIEDMKNSYAVNYENIGENSKIQFSPEVGSKDTIIYSINGGSIYRDSVKIADNISNFKVINYNKNSIEVKVTLADTEETEFCIKYYLGRGY